QFLQLLHGETAVLGQHSAGGIVERVDDLRDGGLLLCPRHGSPSDGRERRREGPGKNERPGRRPRAWIAPRPERGRAGCRSVTCAGRPPSRDLRSLPPGAAVTTSGLWLRREEYGAPVAATKSAPIALRISGPPGLKLCRATGVGTHHLLVVSFTSR